MSGEVRWQRRRASASVAAGAGVEPAGEVGSGVHPHAWSPVPQVGDDLCAPGAIGVGDAAEQGVHRALAASGPSPSATTFAHRSRSPRRVAPAAPDARIAPIGRPTPGAGTPVCDRWIKLGAREDCYVPRIAARPANSAAGGEAEVGMVRRRSAVVVGVLVCLGVLGGCGGDNADNAGDAVEEMSAPSSTTEPATARAATTRPAATTANQPATTATGAATTTTSAPAAGGGVPEVAEFSLGSTATYDDNSTVTVVSYTQPFVDPTSIIPPPSGKEIGVALVEVCTGSRASTTFSRDAMTAYTADGLEVGSTLQGAPMPAFGLGTVGPNQCNRGHLAFAVPAGQRPTHLVWAEERWEPARWALG